MNRTSKLASACIAVAGVLGCAVLASAQQQPPPLQVKKLADDVYWTQGGAGGNTGIIIGKDGVIVVDTKTTVDSARQMLAEIAKLTSKPVTTVILTHSDADHVNGLAAYPTGLTIIATDGCKKEMEASANSRNPAPQDHLPNKIVDKRETDTINGERLVLIHTAPAHTSGDLQVFLPEQKIVFTGDVIAANQEFTLIHAEKNGTPEGWIETTKVLTALKADTYVPGHGDLQTKADVEGRLATVQARYDQIKTMVAEGKTLPEIKVALGEPDPPAGSPAPMFASFTTVVYNDLKKSS